MNNVPTVPEKWYSASRHNEKACVHSFDQFLYEINQICFQPKAKKEHLQGDTSNLTEKDTFLLTSCNPTFQLNTH